jgi:hypothetical protein
VRPLELIEAHADLAQRFHNARFRQFAWAAGVGPGSELADDVAEALPLIARAAHLYRVAPDMVTLLEHAGAALDSSDRFDRDLAPTQCGLVRLERPLVVTEAGGRVMKVHWLMWGPAAGGTMLMLFNDHADPDEFSSAYLKDKNLSEMLELIGRWGVCMTYIALDGWQVGDTTIDVPPDKAMQALMEHRRIGPGTNGMRLVHALWLMLDQTVARVEEEHIRKSVAAQAQRLNVRPGVTVVALRRSDARRGGDSSVEWASRWPVRAYWRWQRFGPGLEQRRRVLVAAHVKGPEGKPLRLPEKIYDVRR